MARKLKTYQTSLGFFEQAIAAPSMKAALEAWGADSNLFHQGAAKEAADPGIVAATMKKPGVVLKRAVGSDGPFREHAELPTNLSDGRKPSKALRKLDSHKPNTSANPIDKVAERKAALAYEREQAIRARERQKEEAAKEKIRARRQQAVAKAKGKLEEAERKYVERAAAIQAEIEKLEKKARTEAAKWEKSDPNLTVQCAGLAGSTGLRHDLRTISS
jgi:hypothetical protein